MNECRDVPPESSKKTAISSPGVSPVSVRLPPVRIRPLTRTRPAGSLVDAATVHRAARSRPSW